MQDETLHKLLSEANLLRLRGYYAEALKKCGCALKLKPDDAGAFMLIGECLEASGKFELALKNYKRALSIEPQNFKIEDRIARLAIKLAEKQEIEKEVAGKVAEELLQVAPQVVLRELSTAKKIRRGAKRWTSWLYWLTIALIVSICIYLISYLWKLASQVSSTGLR